MRTFDTGATRNADDDRLDYEGFLHPAVLKAYAGHMHVHRRQADGQLRASDNWQKGIPKDVYMKSMWRHFHEVWQLHRDTGTADISALSALLFNVMGYMFEELVETGEATRPDRESLPAPSAEVPKAPFQFQVGDTVKVSKRMEDWHRWVSPMNHVVGKVGQVIALDPAVRVSTDEDGVAWYYPPEALIYVPKKGDLVRIVSKQKPEDWDNVWVKAMDHFVGLTGTVRSVNLRTGVRVEAEGASWNYPVESLQLVERA